MDTRVQVVNIKYRRKKVSITQRFGGPPSSNSEDPLVVPDPLLKTIAVKSMVI